MGWFGDILKTAAPVVATAFGGPGAGLAVKAGITAIEGATNDGGSEDYDALLDEVGRGIITSNANRLTQEMINENREMDPDLYSA